MRTLRFHDYGEPADMLRFEETELPSPKAGHIRVRVQACGLNPADWALCRGLMPGALPRGVGFDVAGIVDALGDGVSDVLVGDRVLGVPQFREYPTAGAADFAVLNVWAHAPEGLGFVEAAVLPMAVETAHRCLAILGATTEQTLLIHGAGTMIGFSAAQMATMNGVRVIATAGDTFANDLRAMGVEVTPYGQGMVDRVRKLCNGAPDLIFDAGPISDILPDLVAVAGGDAQRIVTVSNHGPEAEALHVRDSFGAELGYAALEPFAKLAAEGRFRIPVARTFPLENWREAMAISLNGQAHGKLVLLPSA